MARKKKDAGRLGLRTGNPDKDDDQLRSAAFKRWLEREAALKAVCESPIEIGLARMVAAIWVETLGGPLTILTGAQLKDSPGPAEGLTIVAQCHVGKWRVDFLFVVKVPKGPPVYVVVECDGHEFHERTKEQAARDRSRDREMLLMGYRVIRFTGSEIHNNPMDCAEEVLIHLGVQHSDDWLKE